MEALLVKVQEILGNFRIPFPILLIGVGVILVVLYLIFSMIDVHNKSKRNMAYMDRFESLYQTNKNILLTLQTLREDYKKNSPMRKSIDAAIYYLEHSILKDYETALHMISSGVSSKKIEEMHKRILEVEETRVRTLCIG